MLNDPFQTPRRNKRLMDSLSDRRYKYSTIESQIRDTTAQRGTSINYVRMRTLEQTLKITLKSHRFSFKAKKKQVRSNNRLKPKNLHKDKLTTILLSNISFTSAQ